MSEAPAGPAASLPNWPDRYGPSGSAARPQPLHCRVCRRVCVDRLGGKPSGRSRASRLATCGREVCLLSVVASCVGQHLQHQLCHPLLYHPISAALSTSSSTTSVPRACSAGRRGTYLQCWQAGQKLLQRLAGTCHMGQQQACRAVQLAAAAGRQLSAASLEVGGWESVVGRLLVEGVVLLQRNHLHSMTCRIRCARCIIVADNLGASLPCPPHPPPPPSANLEAAALQQQAADACWFHIQRCNQGSQWSAST